MSQTAVVLLAIIAVATLVMALVQVGLIVVVARLGKKLDQVATQIEQEVRPIIAKANAVAENAARVSSLAVVQVERADRVFADLSRRVDESVALVQHRLLLPAREGRAVLAGVGAALAAFRELRAARARAAAEEEDPLFIG